MKSIHISTTGGFGIWVRKGQRVKVTRLEIEDKKIEFYENQ